MTLSEFCLFSLRSHSCMELVLWRPPDDSFCRRLRGSLQKQRKQQQQQPVSRHPPTPCPSPSPHTSPSDDPPSPLYSCPAPVSISGEEDMEMWAVFKTHALHLFWSKNTVVYILSPGLYRASVSRLANIYVVILEQKPCPRPCSAACISLVSHFTFSATENYKETIHTLKSLVLFQKQV